MSKPVAVIGNSPPTLALNDGEVATYPGQTGLATNALTFSYTVQPSDNINDLQATAFNPLPSGTTIRDADGNDAGLALICIDLVLDNWLRAPRRVFTTG
jgi:hypothetical protein